MEKKYGHQESAQTYKYFEVARVLEEQPFGVACTIDRIRKQARLSHATVKHYARSLLLIRHYLSLAVPRFKGKRGWITKLGLPSFTEYFFEPEDRILLKLYDQAAYRRTVGIRQIVPTEIEAQMFCNLLTKRLVELIGSEIRLTAKGVSKAFALKNRYEEHMIQAVYDPAKCAENLMKRMKRTQEINSRIIEYECLGIGVETSKLGELLKKARIEDFDSTFKYLEAELGLGIPK